MKHRRRRKGWREAARRAGRSRELPSTVFLGLGILLPVFLVGLGIYAIAADEVAVPVGRLPGTPTSLPPDSGRLTGAAADAFGIGLFGFALALNAHLIWRRTGLLGRAATGGLLTGFLVVVAAIILAFAG